jgi:hypothetical protein
MSRLTFESSEDTRIIRHILEKAAMGQVFSYAELSTAVGKPLEKFRGSLRTARHQVQRDEGIVFGVERKIGIRRLTDDEIVSASVAGRKAIRNKSSREAQQLSAADYSALSTSKQLLATATMSIFVAIKDHVSDRSVKAIQVLGGSSKSLPIKETLQALLQSREG